MDARHLSYVGPSLDDIEIMPRLPVAYTQLLASQNGFIAFAGGLHVRGAVLEPQWHSIRAALEGLEALHRLFDVLTPADVPFAQNVLGDQYILRNDSVLRLDAETGTLEPMQLDLDAFLEESTADPIGFLGIQPLLNFQQLGGALEPGQLLSVYPPFLIRTDSDKRSFAAVPASQVIGSLAQFVRETQSLPDGSRVTIRVPKA
jgi:hypothetical protein